MAGLEDIASYFTRPNSEGYTVPKTAVLALVFVAGAYAIYEMLKRLKVKADWRLAFAVSPFVLLGSTLRVLVDGGMLEFPPWDTLLVSPNSWLLVASSVSLLLAVSVFLERRKIVPYHKTMFMSGLLAVVFPLTVLLAMFVNLYGMALVLAFMLPWLLVLLLLKGWGLGNRLTLFFQMFDASTTFVTLQFFGTGTAFGYVEQHVLPTFLIGMFGPFSFVVVKAVAVTAALVLIDRFSDDRDFNNYMKLVIGILGAATGGRDFLRLAALV